ncbi:hypothetical protein EJB05_28228, partial [Eragrostis curvula]
SPLKRRRPPSSCAAPPLRRTSAAKKSRGGPGNPCLGQISAAPASSAISAAAVHHPHAASPCRCASAASEVVRRPGEPVPRPDLRCPGLLRHPHRPELGVRRPRRGRLPQGLPSAPKLVPAARRRLSRPARRRCRPRRTPAPAATARAPPACKGKAQAPGEEHAVHGDSSVYRFMSCLQRTDGEGSSAALRWPHGCTLCACGIAAAGAESWGQLS